MIVLEAALALACLAASLPLRPWQMLSGPLSGPWVAALVVLCLLWWLPQQLPGGMPVQFSGACLAVLMFGWPLAVLQLALVAGLVWVGGRLGAADLLGQLAWLGLLPATFALGAGALIRRWLPVHPFVYVLGRAFLGTAVCTFAAGLLHEWRQPLLPQAGAETGVVARWLMAWGEAFLTGMLVAIFVAYRPAWLATWSDRRYLQPGGDSGSRPGN